MSNISSILGSARQLWSRATHPSTVAAQGPAPAPDEESGPSQAEIDERLNRLIRPAVGLEAVVARMDPVGQKLDQVMAAASGPYLVAGATVYSGIQFRMAGGYNERAIRDDKVTGALVNAASRVGLGSKVPLLRNGRAELREVVTVTKALINAGYLVDRGGATREPLADQIHDLQWRFGIGLDCAGYVYQAVSAIYGDPTRLGLTSIENEDFTGLPNNPRFRNVDAAAVQAGDVLVLAGKGRLLGDPGHNLVVRSHCTVLPPGGSVTSQWPGAAAIFTMAAAESRTVHMLEVDSSFSAGDKGDAHGGVRRDVLLWVEGTSTWCTCKSTQPPVVMINDPRKTNAPYGEARLTGFFRPKRTT